MRDENCIFCKIIEGVIPSRVIYEDADFRVMLDVSPASAGHALILTKEHYANLYELPEELAGKAMQLAKRMVTHMTEVLGCDGFNIVQNNHEIAGQTVFHFHMHLIPRYADDEDAEMILWKPKSFTDEQLDELAKKLAQ